MAPSRPLIFSATPCHEPVSPRQPQLRTKFGENQWSKGRRSASLARWKARLVNSKAVTQSAADPAPSISSPRWFLWTGPVAGARPQPCSAFTWSNTEERESKPLPEHTHHEANSNAAVVDTTTLCHVRLTLLWRLPLFGRIRPTDTGSAGSCKSREGARSLSGAVGFPECGSAKPQSSMSVAVAAAASTRRGVTCCDAALAARDAACDPARDDGLDPDSPPFRRCFLSLSALPHSREYEHEGNTTSYFSGKGQTNRSNECLPVLVGRPLRALFLLSLKIIRCTTPAPAPAQRGQNHFLELLSGLERRNGPLVSLCIVRGLFPNLPQRISEDNNIRHCHEVHKASTSLTKVEEARHCQTTKLSIPSRFPSKGAS